MKKLTEFGELFRTLRIRTGISEEDIGKKVGKSQGYMSAIENKEIPLFTFDFVKACIDAFELKEDERHIFLVKAMSCSEKMEMPLTDNSFVMRERFLEILAYVLLNYKPLHDSKRPWIGKCLNTLDDTPPYVTV
jgi:transcriptional regulator with XRE-family HTH domain